MLKPWGPLASNRSNIFTNPVLTEIGPANSKPVSQVALNWLIGRGVAVSPKTSRPERMAENLDVFDFELTADKVDQIASLDTGASLVLDHRVN